MSEQVPRQFSEDGAWWWDGQEWKPALSADGRWRWDGNGWQPAETVAPSEARPAPPVRNRHRFFGPRTEEERESKEARDKAKQALRLAKEEMKQVQRTQQAAIKTAETQLRHVEDTRARTVRNARNALQEAERVYQQSVQEARKELERWTNPGQGRKVASYQGMHLFEHWIQTPQGGAPIIGASATCDTAGNLAVTRRATLTRFVLLGGVGALIFKKKDRHDSRELYLLVETPTVVSAVQCPPDQGLKARQFAAAITTQSARDAEWLRQGENNVPWWQQELERRQEDTGAVVAAQSELARVESDSSLEAEIIAAQRNLIAARSNTGAVEIGRERVQQLEAKMD